MRSLGRLRCPMPMVLPLLALLTAGPARAEEYHYLMIFGAQLDATQPRYTHSWAVFACASGSGPCFENYCLESFTISWSPQTLEMRPLSRPEPGVNLDLYQSLQWAEDLHLRVSAWGPFLIDKETYDRAVQQYTLLESGRVRYKMIDAFHRSDHVSNCIHAVSSIRGGYRLRVVSPSYGQTASYYLVQRFRPRIIDPWQVHDWVYARLGLYAYPIVRRAWNEHPRSGVFWRAVMRLLGRPSPEPTP
jgi:hypothetical protein